MKQLIYQKEHLACINYERSTLPIVEYLHYPKNKKWEQNILEKTIIFNVSGTFSISHEESINKIVREGQGFVLPPGSHYTAYANSDVSFIIFRINGDIRFCDRITLKNLNTTESLLKNELYLLAANTQIACYLHTLISYLAEGFHCEEFLKLKTQELLFLLRSYYPKNTLKAFFQPLLSENMSFADFVFKNYSKVKTVYEFAALSSYSVSGFEKEFRRVFGLSAYQWMTERKVRLLYHEINATEKTFKQIADEMGFSSLSQMNDYCKKHFGIPPGKMRMQKDNFFLK